MWQPQVYVHTLHTLEQDLLLAELSLGELMEHQNFNRAESTPARAPAVNLFLTFQSQPTAVHLECLAEQVSEQLRHLMLACVPDLRKQVLAEISYTTDVLGVRTMGRELASGGFKNGSVLSHMATQMHDHKKDIHHQDNHHLEIARPSSKA
jgi:hypothetical protein